MKTNLIAFDTSVVDLTSDVEDPVETLMKVQLGGGTDIGQAMHYAASLVENPRRTILVLITDFYEGGDPQQLLRVTKRLADSGVHLLGLAALDDKAVPQYDKGMAASLVRLGMTVGAMTPGELAQFVAEKIG
jgi:Mg-chelatase subunit ChlD